MIIFLMLAFTGGFCVCSTHEWGRTLILCTCAPDECWVSP